MPNWCDNHLRVFYNTDKVEELEFVKQLYESAKKEEMLNFLVPMPENEKDNWYEWRLEHWNTKWDITDVVSEGPSNGILDLSFMSAWSSPVEAIKHIKLPFELQFAETGVGFMGEMIRKSRRRAIIYNECSIGRFPNVNIDWKDENQVSKALEDLAEENGISRSIIDNLGLAVSYTDYE